MRDTLLGGAGPAAAEASGRRFPRLRGGADEGIVPIGFVVFFLFLFSSCVSSLDPNEYGLLRNYISGNIGWTVERGGLHFTGPLSGFLKFPAAQVTLQFSKSPGYPFTPADRMPVQTRTGADPNDPDSGGQPISISCALQFELVPAYIRQVYLAFGSFEAAKQRYILLAGNMVGNTAQEFLPNDFWSHRDKIAARMLDKINSTLWHQGSAVAVGFEILKVDFAAKYEDSITAIQVAEQQKVVNEYEQQVQQVVQSISVLYSETMATIANISAGANADSKEMCAAARRDAFNLKQGMKAKKFGQLKSALAFNELQLEEYFKIRSVADQSRSGKVVIGLPSVEETAAATRKTR